MLIFWIIFTYKNPTKNFVIINIVAFIEKVDKNENPKAIEVQKCITFFLPPFFQSAKNPQKNELTTTPKIR
jgi:hypothetical protein